MRPAAEAVPRLLLVIADTASQRRRLTRALLRHCEREPLAVEVVDLAADLNLGSLPHELHRYDGEAWADEIWRDLVPALSPWLALLELDNAAAERPPLQLIPGLDSVLRALFLACRWHRQPSGSCLLVVMPPPAQAVEILQLLRRGPDLLEGLWKPLLAWWAVTRQRLSQFELVLRLHLPTADSLELAPLWRTRLQLLADRLSDSLHPVEALLGLAVDEDDLALLERRVAALPLCGVSHLRLWLEGPLSCGMLEPLVDQWKLPVVLGGSSDADPGFADWLNQPLIPQAALWLNDGDGLRCRLFLPGVTREGLQVRHREQLLWIRSGGLRLEVKLPDDWPQLACRSARVKAPWLEIGFS